MSDVQKVPDGPNVVAYLCIQNCAQAIDYYKAAFGAREVMARIEGEDGKVGHAEITIGNTMLMLADEHPEFGFHSPSSLGSSPVMFVIRVEDVDTAVQRAVDAGGTLSRPVKDQFYGDRSGEITDPYGYRWTLSTHVEDVSEEEMLRRAKELGG